MKQFWSSTATQSGRTLLDNWRSWRTVCVHINSELFGDLRNPRTSFRFFFCFFYIMKQVHSYSLLQCCLAVTLLKGDNHSVFLCGWTVPLRKRSLCSCHDPLWGSYLRLQLLNTSDQNLNAALSASSPNILITREEAECPFSDVNDHFRPEGKNAHSDVWGSCRRAVPNSDRILT